MLDPDGVIALIVDWGGVLTDGISTVVDKWTAQEGVSPADYYAVLGEWLAPDGSASALINPIHELERGQLTVPDFEQQLATALTVRNGLTYEPVGLLDRMFEFFEHAHDMVGLVHRAHAAGVHTALLSNSWGNTYPRDGWDEMFDVVVISGEVGMRKPEERIFTHTLDLLGLAAGQCVFVDDLRHNVSAAVSLGMVGVHHVDYDTTALELEAILGIALRD
ncbi:MAG: HAD family phosphatase [Actinomycetes bacterium]